MPLSKSPSGGVEWPEFRGGSRRVDIIFMQVQDPRMHVISDLKAGGTASRSNERGEKHSGRYLWRLEGGLKVVLSTERAKRGEKKEVVIFVYGGTGRVRTHRRLSSLARHSRACR
jgi:hypothetical protein